ncbi:MAG: DUF4214 domain-containing protein, partial [Proteobacteria bacterium]|nr:DUF4214 domain-containing protein [Pseudomonadota bacterium]
MPNHSVFGAAWRDIMPIGELSIQHSHECQSGGPPAQIPGKACAGWRLATVRFQTTDRATNRWKIQLFFISSEDPSLQPPLNSDDIMVQVRREFARRYGALAPATETADEVDLPCWQPAVPRLPDKPQYVLGDFLRFDDEDFIDVVYRKLLRRPAEDAGSREYLEALRQGAISKVEILGMIRFSGEGRMHSVHVDGLLLPYKLHRWRRVPVIGWFIGMAMAILRLPRLAWHLQHIEASAARESHELGRLLDRMGTAIEGRLGSAELSSMARMDTIGATIAELQERMAANEAAQKQFLTEIQQRQVGLIEQVAAHGMALTDQGEQIAAHDTALADLGERARRDQRSLRAMLERLTVFLDIALQR